MPFLNYVLWDGDQVSLSLSGRVQHMNGKLLSNDYFDVKSARGNRNAIILHIYFWFHRSFLLNDVGNDFKLMVHLSQDVILGKMDKWERLSHLSLIIVSKKKLKNPTSSASAVLSLRRADIWFNDTTDWHHHDLRMGLRAWICCNGKRGFWSVGQHLWPLSWAVDYTCSCVVVKVFLSLF